MQLIIDLDDSKDGTKKEWLIRTLKLVGIKYKTAEAPQTLEEYNTDLEAGKADFEQGNTVDAETLKEEIRKW